MSIENLAASSIAFSLPLSVEFRSTLERTGLVFEGSSGWAEFAPFENYDDEISGRWLAGALEQSFGDWPELLRPAVPINAIIPAVDEVTAAALTFRAVVEFGMTTIKVKVAQPGQSVEQDLKRLEAIKSQLVDLGIANINIRIDANGQWKITEAINLLSNYDLAAGGLDYVEQPCATLAECAEVKQETAVRVAVDEGLRLAKQISAQAIRNSADVLIVKSLPMGGVVKSLEVIEEIGLPVVVSGSLDSSIGLTSGIALAASVRDLAGACGLGTGLIFAEDLVKNPILPRSGEIYFSRPIPDENLLNLANKRVPAQNQIAYQDRMIRSWYASAIKLVSESVREAVEKF